MLVSGIMNGMKAGFQRGAQQRVFSSYLGFSIEHFNNRPLHEKAALSVAGAMAGLIAGDIAEVLLKKPPEVKKPEEQK